jgi:3-hydroxy-9,10-secoandrosta-1,3,5(10)-triene-9,17-dione monooxygenase reductase component
VLSHSENSILSESRKPPQTTDLRNVMKYFPGGVTVVTSALDSGEPFGLTVTAFNSVSLEPPLVLICIRNESTAKDLFFRSRRYCVNLLSEDQQDIAEKFSLTGEAGRFQQLDFYVGKGGSPVIRGCIGYIDCKIVEALRLGDHTVFIGEAVDISATDKPPLLYLNRGYVRLGSN